MTDDADDDECELGAIKDLDDDDIEDISKMCMRCPVSVSCSSLAFRAAEARVRVRVVRPCGALAHGRSAVPLSKEQKLTQRMQRKAESARVARLRKKECD